MVETEEILDTWDGGRCCSGLFVCVIVSCLKARWPKLGSVWLLSVVSWPLLGYFVTVTSHSLQPVATPMLEGYVLSMPVPLSISIGVSGSLAMTGAFW